MKNNPPALLLGLDCLTGLQCARILWRHGVPVVGVANTPTSPYCRTRSVQEVIPHPELAADIPGVLRRISSGHGQQRPVVLACTDEHVWWLNDHRETFAKGADFLLAPSDVLRLLADKARFYQYAIENRLALPDTQFLNNREDIELAIQSMRFPVLLKPPRRTTEWMTATGGFKVLRVEDAQALREKAPALLEIAGTLIVQTWVRGPDINMHSLYICMDRDSRTLASIVVKKIRQWPPDVGVGSLAVETKEEAAERIGLDVLQALGYVGIGSFQCKKDADTGRFFIIEMNTGRPGLNMPVCEACGVEMIYTYYCAAAGLPLPEARTVTYPGSKWICWKSDLASAWVHWRRGDLTLRDWLASLRGRKWSADIQLDDLRPLFADLAKKLTRGLRSGALAFF